MPDRGYGMRVVEDTPRALRTAAFRSLLRTGSLVRAEQLAADVGLPLTEVEERLRTMERAGWIRLNDDGLVVGSCGLNVTPDRHRLDFGDRSFWTWCAWDALGIFGALGVSGTVRSFNPVDGAPLHLAFRLGTPEHGDLVLFRPDEDYGLSCANLYEDWCSKSNFFEGEDAARTWAVSRDVQGQVLALPEATALAGEAWAPLTRGIRL